MVVGELDEGKHGGCPLALSVLPADDGVQSDVTVLVQKQVKFQQIALHSYPLSKLP